jgi:hypothetical protein
MTTASFTETKPSRSPARIGLIVLGVVVGALALTALVGGGALLWLHTDRRDHDGYYSTGAKTLATPTYALVSDGLDIGTDGPDWLFRKGRLGTIRVTATGTAAEPVFVGIARSSQTAAYLAGVAHDDITDFEVDPFSVTRARRGGAATPAAPTAEAFWAKTATGAGRQTLTWSVKKGSWNVVVMNADGSRSVRAAVTLGAKVPWILWLAIGLLTAGVLLAAGSAAAIYSGVRKR